MDKLQLYNRIGLLCLVLFLSRFTFSQSGFEINILKECEGDSTLLEITPQVQRVLWTAKPNLDVRISSPTSTNTWVKIKTETTFFADIENTNVVLKENFEDTLNFESEYLYDNNIDKNGYISITPLPHIHFSAWTNISDHDGNNSMLVADGDTLSKVVYLQKFHSEKDQSFTVSIWGANVHRFFATENPDTSITKSAGFAFLVNDVEVKRYTLPLDTLWHEITFEWKATEGKENTFKIINNVNSIKGNDFALDDLKITSIKKETISKTISVCNQGPTFSPNGDGIDDSYYIATEGKSIIYDLSGKIIKTIYSPAFWDGTDETGNFVSSGYYAITVDGLVYGRVTVIK